jgi:6-pyruvoyltetrahydropterin/6-carboxytetrahydropterin synthase
MVYLTRVERFNAAHKLWVKSWSEEKNFAVFGKCANKNWHGHNYYLHVTIKGKPDPFTGFIMDAKKLGQIIKDRVTEKLDHSNLNLDVDFIPEGTQPRTPTHFPSPNVLARFFKTDAYSVARLRSPTLFQNPCKSAG